LSAVAPPLERTPAAQEVVAYAKRFRKVVVWGLRHQWHSHRFIHKAFAETFERLGVPVVWTDYTSDPETIERGDFVITSNAYGRGTKGNPLAPFRDGAYYCFHGFLHSGYRGDDRPPRHEIAPEHCLNLEVFVNKALAASDRWDVVTYFDRPSKTLHQPWGTNLTEDRFRSPVVSRSPFVFWVGAIWDNEQGQGNLAEIAELRQVLRDRSLRFVHLKFVPDWVNVSAIRRSRVAPAIAGGWQVDENYLPCRMFKNVSYGQLGISNVPKFAELYAGCHAPGATIEELIENALLLPRTDRLRVIAEQQEVTRRHTYVHKIRNIFRAMLEF
jgi:hypothetical protein